MKKNLNIMIVVSLLFISGLMSCQDEYYFDGGLSQGELGVSTYDYLTSEPRHFDTLTWVIDLHNMKDVVNGENNTFFAPQDDAFKLFLAQLALDPLPKSLEELPQNIKDTLGLLTRKYIVPGKIMRSNVTNEGKINTTNANDEPVSIFFNNTPRGGIPGFGPKFLVYGATVTVENTITGMPEDQERFAIVSTSDLESTNGAVHVIEVSHTFGF